MFIRTRTVLSLLWIQPKIVSKIWCNEKQDITNSVEYLHTELYYGTWKLITIFCIIRYFTKVFISNLNVRVNHALWCEGKLCLVVLITSPVTEMTSNCSPLLNSWAGSWAPSWSWCAAVGRGCCPSAVRILPSRQLLASSLPWMPRGTFPTPTPCPGLPLPLLWVRR